MPFSFEDVFNWLGPEEAQARTKLTPEEFQAKMKRIDDLEEPAVDVAIPPEKGKQAEARLNALLNQGMSESDALKILKLEFETGRETTQMPATRGELLGEQVEEMQESRSPTRTRGDLLGISAEMPKGLPIDLGFTTRGDILSEPAPAEESVESTTDVSQLPDLPIEGAGEGKGVGEKVWDIAKEYGPDMAAVIGEFKVAGGVALALGAAGAIPTGGVSLALAAGLTFTALNMGRRLLGGEQLAEPGLVESGVGFGAELLGLPQPEPVPEVIQPFIETAENVLFFGGLGKVRKIVQPNKKIMKGVQRSSLFKPLEPVGEAIWENVFVAPTRLTGVKGIAAATTLGAGVGAGAGALKGAFIGEDPLEEALTGALVGAGAMAGLSAYASHKGLSLKEAMQPAIERLRKDQPKVAGSFRATKVQAALAQEVFSDTLKEAKGLLFTEQAAFIKGLQPGAALPVSAKAKDLVIKTMKRLGAVTKPQFETTFIDELSKLSMKPIDAVESSVTPSSLKRLFTLLERPLTGKTSFKPKEAQKILREVIRNPRFTPEIQQYAKDLYNFSAQAPRDVAEALTTSSTEYLVSKLMNNPGVVSSTLKPGYVRSQYPSIKGLFVSKDIDLELEAMRKIPQIGDHWVNKWFMSPWKTNKIILRTATQARNIFGTFFSNDVYGGMNSFNPLNVKRYWEMAKDLHNMGPYTQRFKQLTGMVGRWSKEESGQALNALRYESNIFDKGLNLFDTIAAPGRGVYSWTEAWGKISKFKFNLDKGMPEIEAAYDAIRCTLNYSEVTPLTAQIRSKAIPFFTWGSKIIPMTIEAAVKHPLRLGKWIALGLFMQDQALDAVGVTEEEWETIRTSMPEYMKKGMYLLMPWRDEKKQLKMMNMTWMIPGIGDISELTQRGGVDPVSLIFQQPLLNLAATLLSKKKFSGAPLYYDWESPGVKAAKTLGAVWEMWSPALAPPSGVDWKTLQDAVQDQPGALSSEEAIASQFGLRLTTVDPLQMRRRSEVLRKIHETEISTEMRKELRRNKDPGAISDITNRYRGLLLEQRD